MLTVVAFFVYQLNCCFFSFAALPDAFLDNALYSRYLICNEQLWVIVTMGHTVNLVELLFNFLQRLYWQTMQDCAVQDPQFALEAPLYNLVRASYRCLVFLLLNRLLAFLILGLLLIIPDFILKVNIELCKLFKHIFLLFFEMR